MPVPLTFHVGEHERANCRESIVALMFGYRLAILTMPNKANFSERVGQNPDLAQPLSSPVNT